VNEEAAFLKAIRGSPADDTVRLVYADWLQEHGGRPERAEFIRLQVKKSQRWPSGNVRIKDADDSRDYERLLRREREFFLAHAVEWIAGLPGADEAPALHPGCRVSCGIGPAEFVFEYVFRRGFPEPVEKELLPAPPLPPPPTHELVGEAVVPLDGWNLIVEPTPVEFQSTRSARTSLDEPKYEVRFVLLMREPTDNLRTAVGRYFGPISANGPDGTRWRCDRVFFRNYELDLSRSDNEFYRLEAESAGPVIVQS
jgi:uncharacterized protein (TIGR02996 family)